MKTFSSLASITLGALVLLKGTASGAETNSPARVGVYDSRAVAYAWFCSDDQQKELRQLMDHARTAQTAGDTNSFQNLSRQLRELQDEMHREVFSTAMPTGALAVIKGRLPEIQNKTGVTNLVSKWDEPALKAYSPIETIDVTDQLVHEFIQPTEKQTKIISSMIKSKPLSLEECDKLIKEGKI